MLFRLLFGILTVFKLLNVLAAIFLLNRNNAILSPAFFGQRFNNVQWAALLKSSVQ